MHQIMKNTPAPESEIFYEAQISDKKNIIANRFYELLKATIEKAEREISPLNNQPPYVGINWERAYMDMVEYVMEYARTKTGWPENLIEYITPEDIEASTNMFMQELKAADGKYYLFQDACDPEQLAKLTSLASKLALWTMGDITNNYQQTKIDSSGLEKSLNRATKSHPSLPTEITINITDQKTELIPELLEKFWIENNRPQKIAVIIIDDSLQTFKKSEGEIKQWLKRKRGNVEIKKIFIRSKRGKKKEENWQPVIEQPINEGCRIEDFATIAQEKLAGTYIPREHTILLLDFDGTVADNEKLENTQTRLVQNHLLALFEKGIRKWIDNGADGTMENAEEYYPNILIYRHQLSPAEIISAYTHQMLSRLTPLWQRETAFTRPTEIYQKLKGEIGYQIPETSLPELEKLDALYRDSGGLLHWKAYRQMVTEWMQDGFLADRMDENTHWPDKFQGKDFWEDKTYYQNPLRMGLRPSGLDKALYNLLLSDEKRMQAKTLAEETEKRIERVCRDKDGKVLFPFISGGIKSRKSLVEKIERMGIGKINDIGDLVRGMVVVDNLEDLVTCSAALATEFKKDIVRFNNFYRAHYRDEKTGEPRAFKSHRMIIRLSDEITYELQVRTKRSKAASDLDHETTMKQNVKLNPEEENYVLSLFWMANALDCEDFLKKKLSKNQTIRFFHEKQGTITWQSKQVNASLFQCFISGANLAHPDIKRDLIMLFTEKWLASRPSTESPEKWDNKLQKALFLVRKELENIIRSWSGQLNCAIALTYGNKWHDSRMKVMNKYRHLTDEQIRNIQQQRFNNQIEKLVNLLSALADWDQP